MNKEALVGRCGLYGGALFKFTYYDVRWDTFEVKATWIDKGQFMTWQGDSVLSYIKKKSIVLIPIEEEPFYFLRLGLVE